jgi:hypothetical protein
MKSALWTATVVAVALCAFSPAALAEEGSESASGMDHEKMKKAWEAAATPGQYHERLDWFVGDWTAKITSFMGGEPVVAQGTARFTWELGGRYVYSVHESEFNGMPFEGRGIDGYDNTTGKYFSIWTDNMGTGYLLSEGEPCEEGKPQVVSGTMSDPTMGTVKTRFVTNITGDDSFLFEMYMTAEGMPETKSMEIEYTRVDS